ncbi:hypothetical protein [Streptomyces sp. NPDC088785]|uniref:hypothetical protein n=1 Tax=Streptomyces sp. NPDC088785 TaxID=3365897 RepID=UPI0038046BDF
MERPDEDVFAAGCLVALVLALEAACTALVGFTLVLRGLGGPAAGADRTEVWCWGGGAVAALAFGVLFLWLRRPWAGSAQVVAALGAATLAVAAWQRGQT